MNINYVSHVLSHVWKRKHILYTYPLSKLAMISPFVGTNAFLHKLRGVTVGKEVKIAHDVIIGPVEPTSIILEDYVTISPRAVIFGHHTSPDVQGKTESVNPTIIREGTWICIGATLMPGVTVGKFCVIGAGAVVTKDVPDFTLVMGNPAQPVRTLKKIYKIPEDATLDRVLVLEDSK